MNIENIENIEIYRLEMTSLLLYGIKKKIPEARQIDKNWVCKNGRLELKTKYIHI